MVTTEPSELAPKSLSPLQIGRECYLFAVGRVLVVEILGIYRNTIWITFPTADSIGEGTGVDLEFHTPDGGSVTYHARVAIGPKNTINGIMLERAESPTHLPNRRDWRVPAEFPAWIREPGSENRHKAEIRNLTANGAHIVTQAPFEAGDVLELTFQLPDDVPQRLRVQIVYCDKTRGDEVNRFGLRFIDVPANVKKSLTWFLYEKIQQLYAGQLRDLYPPARPRR